MEAFETWWKEHFRLHNVRVKYAKIEAVLSSALASVQADGQNLPYLDYVGEDGIRWWGVWKDACQKLWELGAEMHVVWNSTLAN